MRFIQLVGRPLDYAAVCSTAARKGEVHVGRSRKGEKEEIVKEECVNNGKEETKKRNEKKNRGI